MPISQDPTSGTKRPSLPAVTPAPTNDPRRRDWWRPENLDEAEKLASRIAGSGLVPDQYVKNPGAVFVAMMFAEELGLSVLAALQNVAIVNGKPSVYGDAIPALIKTAPDYEPGGIEEIPIVVDDQIIGWRCTMRRRGEADVVREFTIDDAKTAGLWGGMGVRNADKRYLSPWVKTPVRMLQMRARSWAARDQWPDRLTGISVAEDLQDVEKIADIEVISTAPLEATDDQKEVQVETPAPEDVTEVELPPEPRLFSQKSRPTMKRAKPGDVWIHKDSGVVAVLLKLDLEDLDGPLAEFRGVEGSSTTAGRIWIPYEEPENPAVGALWLAEPDEPEADPAHVECQVPQVGPVDGTGVPAIKGDEKRLLWIANARGDWMAVEWSASAPDVGGGGIGADNRPDRAELSQAREESPGGAEPASPPESPQEAPAAQTSDPSAKPPPSQEGAGEEAAAGSSPAAAEKGDEDKTVRHLLWERAAKLGIDAKALKSLAGDVLERTILVSSDFTDEEIPAILAEIDLRFGGEK